MDHYEVIRRVGQGAFGSALLVKHRHGGDALLYVIKEINLRQLSARDKDASRKEVTLLSKMKHPNIVTFYKSFYDRNNLYILMEYCDAGDLMNRIKMQRGKPFTEQQFEGSNLKQLVLKICRGRYSPVSQRYSDDLRLLLNQLFKVSPRDRPSANSLLRRPLLQAQISKHLDTQLLEDEFSHTVLHGHTPPAPKADPKDPVGYKPVLRPPVNRPVQRPEQRRTRANAQQIKPRFPAVVENPIGLKPRDDHERRWDGPAEPADRDTHTPAALEPYKLVARARDEYLQRRHEAHQYKIRAQKQLGLRPSTADAEGGPASNAQEHHGSRPSPSGKVQGQKEYLKQLQRIREQYRHDVREMRMRAEVEDRETDLLRKNRDTHTHGKEQQRGIMFEIKLSDKEMKTDEEDEESEDEPLNNTLTFEQGENLRNRPHGSEEEERMKRAEWCRDAAETLLNALEHMDVMTESISDTQTVSEQQDGGHRKHWTKRLPETLLNALAQAQLTDCSAETLIASEEKSLTEEERDENESDEEVDKERLEPRSDDEDTNFEESEDELREEVSDSMRNLLIITQDEDTHTDGAPQEEVTDESGFPDYQKNTVE